MYEDKLEARWFTFIDQREDLAQTIDPNYPKLYDVPSLYFTLTWNPGLEQWGNGQVSYETVQAIFNFNVTGKQTGVERAGFCIQWWD